MAPSFDSGFPSLLCAEDDSVFDDCNESGSAMEFEVANWYNRKHKTYNNQNQMLNGGEGFLPLLSDECFGLMMKKEWEFLPCADYLKRLKNGDLDINARNEAVDWIGKVNVHFKFGPLCYYLAINYLDRFFSAYELPKGNAWTIQLLAVACLSLAAKIEETEVPLSLDLQVGGSKFVFEARTIQRMELLVLSTLRWKMQAVTPFSFIDYFLQKIQSDEISVRVSILRLIQLISSTLQGIDFLVFRPSEIAAAVAICVADETQSMETQKAISALIQHVDKEKLLKCIQLVNKNSLICGSLKDETITPAESVPQSPSGILDIACLSYRSNEATTVGSCANSSYYSPRVKRRRLNTPCEVEL